MAESSERLRSLSSYRVLITASHNGGFMKSKKPLFKGIFVDERAQPCQDIVYVNETTAESRAVYGLISSSC